MTNFFFFGATGDHAKLKIIPALYLLFLNKKIDQQTKFFAIGRSNKTNLELEEIIKSSVENYLAHDKSDKYKLQNFINLFKYLQIDSEKVGDYQKLNGFIGNDKKDENLFYLSIPPQSYMKVLDNLETLGLSITNSKILLEKPFGLDMLSANELDQKLNLVFENNVFRIDHYLGKAKVLDLLFDEKTNQIISENLSNKNLTKIEISNFENFGVENRGEFFDKVGALIDVGQNHLLEIAAILAIDKKELKNDNFAKLRATEIEKFEYISSERSQYEGYKQILNVSPNSQTETAFELVLRSRNPKFANIEIVLKAGKKFAKNAQVLTFHFDNRKVFEYNFSNKFIDQANMEDVTKSSEYYFLIQKALNDECCFFVSDEEIKAQWNIIEKVKKDWKSGKVKLEFYEQYESFKLP